MDLTQEQFAENLSAMPEEEQMAAVSVIENSEPIELKNFAKALGVNLILGEEAPVEEEAPLPEEEIPVEEGEVPLPEEEVLPSPVEEIEGVPAAEPEPPSVLPPPAIPEPVPERPIDQEMQALALGDEVEGPASVPEEIPPEVIGPKEPPPEVAGPIAVPGAKDTGVSDDVPMTGKEGDFILTAEAVTRSGKIDVEKKLRDAIDAAAKDGIEVKLRDIVKPAAQVNGNVQYMASNKEIRIPEVLVSYIGTDVLEKMNRAAEAETEKQIAEEEQQPAESAPKQKREIPVRA